MPDFDFIMVGGGAAGLSLAYHLTRSPLHNHSILIVDREAKTQNDRTWCFWTAQPTAFDPIVYRTWRRLRFVGGDFAATIDVEPYRYQMLRSIEFYQFVREALSVQGRVTWVQGTVDYIEDEDGADFAVVVVGGDTYRGRWVFDSRFGHAGPALQRAPVHCLHQHFHGWEVETATPVFDPHAATLLDFRTPQHHDWRFFYVLPFSACHALVEHVWLHGDAHAGALPSYLEAVLGCPAYRILSEEHGVNPLTDQHFARQVGRRILTIGARGGRLKPSTGYAFDRIQQDSAAIVRSLLEVGHPFNIPAAPRRYHVFDSILLDIMAHEGEQIEPIFTALFRHNPIGRIFRFLDERAGPRETLALIATLPPAVFLQAVFRMKVLTSIARA